MPESKRRISSEEEKRRNREYAREKYRNLTPEQKEVAKAKMRARWPKIMTPERRKERSRLQMERIKSSPARKAAYNEYHRNYQSSLSSEKKAASTTRKRERQKSWTAEEKAAHYGRRRDRELRSKLPQDKQESQREYFRQYWKGIHPDKKIVYNVRARIRQSAIARSDGHFTAEQWSRMKIDHDYRCLKCGRREPEIKLTVDHIVPISKGGSDKIENIQPLCRSCNCSKGTKTISYAA